MIEPDDVTPWMGRVVDHLADYDEMRELFHLHRHGEPLPSAQALGEIVSLARAVLFPGYFGRDTINRVTARFHIGVAVERMYHLLSAQVEAGLCFDKVGLAPGDSEERRRIASEIAARVIGRLPRLRAILATDVEAAYVGDPAATNFGEVISCYPAIRALTGYRFAHELHLEGVPLIPRIITETVHSETGIDIHPAAEIGPRFTIDHGTGVVIGATCVIGAGVKLYQGVTLGAKSFPLDDDGHPVKGVPRHPILEDGVIVYSNATILGRVTIGRGAVIGANVWLTEDVPAGVTVKP